MITHRSYRRFTDFNLSSKLQEAVKQARFDRPTELQAKVIPAALEGKDVIFEARSGMGKSACFAIPFIQRWLRNRSEKAIIITTNAASVQQLKKVTTRIASNLKAKVLGFSGDDDYFFPELHSKCPLVIIELPIAERFFRRERDYVSSTKMLGLDQFDLLIENEQMLNELVSKLPADRQTLICVDQLTNEVLEKARWYCNAGNLEKIQLTRPDVNWEGKNVELQYALVEDDNERFKIFLEILTKSEKRINLVLTDSDRISSYLVDRLRSEAKKDAKLFAYTMPIDQKNQLARQIADSKKGIMIGCDAAFNGVSVPPVDHLICWNLPQQLEQLWRRIDRFLVAESLLVSILLDRSRAGAIKIIERRLNRTIKDIKEADRGNGNNKEIANSKEKIKDGDKKKLADSSKVGQDNQEESDSKKEDKKKGSGMLSDERQDKTTLHITERFLTPVWAKEEDMKRYAKDGRIKKTLGSKFLPAKKKKIL